jgi:RNA polymerase sigma-70 factor, ECF subfamily
MRDRAVRRSARDRVDRDVSGHELGDASGHPRDFDLRELVVEHRADIFRYARSLTRNDADAEDLAQSAMVRALAAGIVVREPEKAKWYLLRIVRNLATDQARSRARLSIEPWAILPEAPSPDLEPEAILLREAAKELPRAAFADLAPGHQEILRLRFVEELDYHAVAARLETTEHAARQRVYRAMQALRAIAQRHALDFRG